MVDAAGPGSGAVPAKLPDTPQVEGKQSSRLKKAKADLVRGGKDVKDKAIGTLETGAERLNAIASRPLAMSARFMSRLVNSVAFKTIFPGKQIDESTPTPTRPASQRKAVKGIIVKNSPLEQRFIEKQQGQRLKSELTNIHTVLSECAAGEKKPQLTEKGELVARDWGRNQKTEAALDHIVKTLHHAAIVNAELKNAKGIETSLDETRQLLDQIPQVAVYAAKSPAFQAKLDALKESVAPAAPKVKSLHKATMVLQVVTGANPDLSLMLIQTHRNNGQTVNLLSDMNAFISTINDPGRKNEAIKNALYFGLQYLKMGDSVPVSSNDRAQLRDDLLKFVELGKSSDQSELQELGDLLQQHIQRDLPAAPANRQVSPGVILSKLNDAKMPSPDLVREGYEQVRRATHILEAKSDLAKVSLNKNKAVEEKIGKLAKKNAELKDVENMLEAFHEESSLHEEEIPALTKQQSSLKQEMGELEKDIGRLHSDIAKISTSMAQLNRQYLNLENNTVALKNKLAEIADRSPKFSLETASAEEFAVKVGQLMEAGFARISLSEFDKVGWSNPVSRHELAPNLLDYTAAFNTVSGFVANQILSADNPREVAEKAIEAAHIELHKKNYAAAQAILSALELAEVHNVKSIWEDMDEKFLEKRDEVSKAFPAGSNPTALYRRMEGDAAQGQTVPHIAPYLTALTFTNDGNQDQTEITLNFDVPGGEPIKRLDVNIRKNEMFAGLKDKIAGFKTHQPDTPVEVDLGFMAALAEISNTPNMEAVLREKSKKLRGR